MLTSMGWTLLSVPYYEYCELPTFHQKARTPPSYAPATLPAPPPAHEQGRNRRRPAVPAGSASGRNACQDACVTALAFAERQVA